MLSRLSEVSGQAMPLMPVVKADAYGHGACLIARALEESFSVERLPCFCVARWAEAVELREAGITRPVLVLSQYCAEEMRATPLSGVSLLVASPQDVKVLEDIGPRGREALRGVHLHFNTGMRRLGFSSDIAPKDAFELFSKIAALGLKVEALSTHLARAEEDPSVFTQTQRQRFEGALRTCESVWESSWGPFPRWIHAANSAGLLRDLGPRMTAARPGLFLWGVHQDLEARARLTREFPGLKLRPVLGLRCAVRDATWVEKGEGVSYGHRWVAPSRRLVGVLNFGYADGLSRSLSRSEGDPVPLSFWIEGHPVPILGTVTMDMVMVDLTEHPRRDEIPLRIRAAGETVWAEWIGDLQPVEKHASALGTISYEVLCDLSRRVKREARNA